MTFREMWPDHLLLDLLKLFLPMKAPTRWRSVVHRILILLLIMTCNFRKTTFLSRMSRIRQTFELTLIWTFDLQNSWRMKFLSSKSNCMPSQRSGIRLSQKGTKSVSLIYNTVVMWRLNLMSIYVHHDSDPGISCYEHHVEYLSFIRSSCSAQWIDRCNRFTAVKCLL